MGSSLGLSIDKKYSKGGRYDNKKFNLEEMKFHDLPFRWIQVQRKTKTRRPKKHDKCIYKVNQLIIGRTAKKETCLPLKITSIFEQKLQDISRSDVVKEGFLSKQDFIGFWDLIYSNSKYEWKKNPLVFVYEFYLIVGK